MWNVAGIRAADEHLHYDLFFRRLDAQKYRALLTDDYLLLENGEIFDADGDIASMPKPEDDYRRTDAFEFEVVQANGDSAYAVYFLRSDMQDKKEGARHSEWLESAALRRTGDR
jgi:ketosteroid isomerase-like protein